MADPFLGEIRIFAGNFAPRGWAFCDGQLLPIAQNAALFSLLGTIYGGDGRQTFALPDMRGRSPAHQGRGPGLSDRRLGARYGTPTVTLDTARMPAHSHGQVGTRLDADTPDPVRGLPATGVEPAYTAVGNADTTMASAALTSVGEGQPHENRPPSLVVNYIIATQGIFPSRS